MADYKNLLETLVWAVKCMRDYQRLIVPGAPLAIRNEAKKWEQEVDALVELHQLPELLPFPQPEGGK